MSRSNSSAIDRFHRLRSCAAAARLGRDGSHIFSQLSSNCCIRASLESAQAFRSVPAAAPHALEGAVQDVHAREGKRVVAAVGRVVQVMVCRVVQARDRK